MIPTLIEIVDMSVVNVALDHIRGSLSAGIDESTWTITTYLVSNAIIIPITGWLSRVFGRKAYLLFSIAMFAISSLFCGLAWNLESLIVFRIFQGLGGGALQPISQSILLETFPPRQHGIAMAFFGVGIMFGPIVGPLLGGWITDNWSWHWIFFINVPIGILSIVMTLLFIKDPHYMMRAKMKMDYIGLFLIAVGLGCLQVVLDKGEREDWFASSLIVWLSVISVISLALFVWTELRAETPVVNLKIFRNRSFSAGNTIMFFTFFNLFSSIVLLPLYLQTLMGYTATLAGIVLGPGGFATVIALVICGPLVSKVNPKGILVFGILTGTASLHLMSQFNLLASFEAIMWPRVALGFSLGFFFIPLTNLTLSTVRKEDMANATAIFNLLRNLGGSFGVAFLTTILARRAQFHQSRLVEHLTPFDVPYQMLLEKGRALFAAKGFAGMLAEKGALGVMYKNLMKEATMLAFNDTFFLLSVMMICLLPLVFMLRRGQHTDVGPVH
jgi:MFS transporter, DHA2 family, multidrug resistance protein